MSNIGKDKIIWKCYAITFEDNHGPQLNSTCSKTNGDSGTLASIFCDANVDCLVANSINRLRWMHREEHWSLIHVDDEVLVTMGLIKTDSWACNVHNEVSGK